jgi:hypothetical protein
MRLFRFAVVLILLAGAGCDDDDDPGSVSKIVGNWEVISSGPEITITGGGTLVELLVSFGMSQQEAEQYAAEFTDDNPVEIDGTIEFKKDGTYHAVDGTGDVSDGQWELSTDEKKLTIDKDTNAETVLDVTTLNDTDLVLDVDMTGETGFPEGTIEYHAVVRLKRK